MLFSLMIQGEQHMNNELNKIENAIKEIDAATFQKLCDEYLSRKIGGQLLPLGSEDGKNKPTKGTPDSYIIKDNGTIYLMEYTSQKNNLLKKVNADLEKIDKLKIDKRNVKGIFYCSATSNIAAEDIDSLKEKYAKQKIGFQFITNFNIAIDIRDKYRDLANKYLGFELPPSQLKNIVDFANEYNMQFNGTLLNTYFGYRGTELEKIKKAFENNNVILLTGKAGVGKTRLAFEFARKFNGDKYFVHNVYDMHGLILEIQTEFEDEKSKLIVFDDANQIDDLKKVFQAFLSQMKSGKIKILITVRDYAKDRVEEEINNYLQTDEIELQNLSGEQIRDCVKKVYKINNEIILDRICDISYGNLRMAMLAADAYSKDKQIATITDMSQVYDRLLGDAIKNVVDNRKLISLGLIAFLKHFDINNNSYSQPLYMNILNKLNISIEEFKEDIKLFNKMELIDFINSRFVNFPDQTLENYVLKVVFMDKKLLSLSQIMELVFESNLDVVYSHVINLENTFYNEHNREYLTQEIRKVWQYLKSKKSNQYLKFVSLFARFDIGEAIILAREEIDHVEQYTGNVDFKIESGVIFSDLILKIIDSISYTDNYKYATQLFYEYLIKQPQRFDQFYFAIIQDWKINYNVPKRQLDLIKRLTEKDSLEHEQVIQLLLLIAPEYLSLIFEKITNDINGKSYMMFRHFQICATKEVLELRKYLWNSLIKISSKYPDRVKRIVKNYARDLLQFSNTPISSSTKEVVKFDITYLTPIIKELFDNQSVADCVIISWIQDRLTSIDMKLPVANSFLENNDYKLYESLEKIVQENGLNADAALKEFVEKYMTSKVTDLTRILKIAQNFEEHNMAQIVWLDNILKIILDELKNDKDKYITGIKFIMSSDIRDDKIFYDIFGYMCSAYPSSQILFLIDNNSNDKKDNLYYIYFCCLPQNKVNMENYNLLKKYLANETIEDVGIYKSRSLSFLYKFNFLDSNAMEKCCQIISSKGKAFRKIYFHLWFIDESWALKVVNSFKDIKLLEQIYIDCILNDGNDYLGYYLLSKIYKKDKSFLSEYISEILINRLKKYRVDDERQLLVLLMENDGNDILNTIWNVLWKTENYTLVVTWSEILAKWIRKETGVKNKIDIWLKQFIRENASDNLKIKLLMEGLACQSLLILQEYLKEYILTKPKIEDFKAIALYRGSYSISDNESSINGVFNNDINNLKKLSTWLEDQGLDYILYKKWVDDCIEYRIRDREDEIGRLKADMF